MIAYVSNVKTYFVEFGIKILAKFIDNTENFTNFVFDNHSGLCLYFIDFQNYKGLTISADYQI